MNTNKCNFCGKSTGGRTVEAAIKHFEKKHPKFPEHCYRDYGKTWDDTLNRILFTLAQQNDKLGEANTKVIQLEAAYKQEAAIRTTLATKLNGIIMILEHKS